MPAVLSGNVMKVDSILTALKDKVHSQSLGNQQPEGVVMCTDISSNMRSCTLVHVTIARLLFHGCEGGDHFHKSSRYGKDHQS